MRKRGHWSLGNGRWSKRTGTFVDFSGHSPMYRACYPSRERGVTLVELVISIVIVSMAAAAVLGVLSLLAKGSADAMIRNQAVAIATAYLEEVRLKNFVANGKEGSRGLYDDVSDYDALQDKSVVNGGVGARDQLGNGIAGLGQYTVTVTVGPGTLGSVPVAAVKRIDVNVQHPAGVNLTISGYRTAL